MPGSGGGEWWSQFPSFCSRVVSDRVGRSLRPWSSELRPGEPSNLASDWGCGWPKNSVNLDPLQLLLSKTLSFLFRRLLVTYQWLSRQCRSSCGESDRNSGEKIEREVDCWSTQWKWRGTPHKSHYFGACSSPSKKRREWPPGFQSILSNIIRHETTKIKNFLIKQKARVCFTLIAYRSLFSHNKYVLPPKNGFLLFLLSVSRHTRGIVKPLMKSTMYVNSVPNGYVSCHGSYERLELCNWLVDRL